MRVAKLKSENRIEQNVYMQAERVKAYGGTNAYPQEMLDLIAGSRTASSCMSVMHKFVRGLGFTIPALETLKVNKKQSLFRFHQAASREFCRFGGLAVLVGYNGLLDEVSRDIIPFEHCRLEIDKDKNFTGRIAVHPDWAKQSGRPFKKTDIKYFYPYTPNKTDVVEIVKGLGGFENFDGLIYYYSNETTDYPLSPLDPVRELMAVQAGADNIRLRNVRYNFLPSGILYKKKSQFIANNTDPEAVKKADAAWEAFQQSVVSWQGDDVAAKMLLIEQEEGEEDVVFKGFPIQNLDKITEYTDTETKQGIQNYMCIPPELLGQSGNRGFTADAMQEAYDAYNSYTAGERDALEDAYRELFVNFAAANGMGEIKIKELTYKASPAEPQIPPA